MLAITDHNASAHIPAALRLADEFNLTVVPGMEVNSREEVHVLALFAQLDSLTSFQALVDQSLPAEKNRPEYFGYQTIYDEYDEVIDLDEQLRQVGTSLTLEALTKEIRQRGGIIIPAHVLRRSYSLKSQLGFISETSDFDALQISAESWQARQFHVGDRLHDCPVMRASDAHFLDDVGKAPTEIRQTSTDIRSLMRFLQQGDVR